MAQIIEMEHEQVKQGLKGIMTGFQASARGGVVKCVWEGERVLLSGKAITVFRGELLI
jgi:hypothetical protein